MTHERRKPTPAEMEAMRSYVMDKLKILNTSIDVSIQKLFKKRMGFALAIFDTEGLNRSHMYITNVTERGDLANVLRIIIDMIEHPEDGEEGDLSYSVH